ncbi:MAG: hypothetical protein LBC88_03755 [Spirochaetaceae bacterium]|jgi:hypothetical protein|nr:hypothetical protein [Spirochaetaceae bacterium]
MVIDRLDRWTERTIRLLNSKEGRFYYTRNKYEFGLTRRNNICGIIEKACGRLRFENQIAVYNQVEQELRSHKVEAE